MKRLPLVLIIAIAVLTPLLSTGFYFWWQPRQTTHLGELLPPAPLATDGWSAAAREAAAAWRGHWVLVSGGGGGCDAACRQRLCRMRALHLALPGAYQRLRRAWWVSDGQAAAEAILMPSDCGEGGAEVAARAREVDVLDGVDVVLAAGGLPAGGDEAAIYLLDADGTWVIRFAPTLTIYEMRQDIGKLLKLSKGRKFFRE